MTPSISAVSTRNLRGVSPSSILLIIVLKTSLKPGFKSVHDVASYLPLVLSAHLCITARHSYGTEDGVAPVLHVTAAPANQLQFVAPSMCLRHGCISAWKNADPAVHFRGSALGNKFEAGFLHHFATSALVDEQHIEPGWVPMNVHSVQHMISVNGSAVESADAWVATVISSLRR
jgi:hypothetical protein